MSFLSSNKCMPRVKDRLKQLIPTVVQNFRRKVDWSVLNKLVSLFKYFL